MPYLSPTVKNQQTVSSKHKKPISHLLKSAFFITAEDLSITLL
ncbi:hypothetical protein RSSL_01281 [Streptococcus salivarius K12]|uniref:Uncharacterized protein n=1 Tax=Streptococcus salivarius K12 TaxID=1200793 RepID=J7SIT4_STRSL|nr:hypothetical protein RSSL_01281 [Streptococcus salivarius K12]